MKRLLSISMTLLIMAMFSVFAACSKNEESLSGTKWVAAYLDNRTFMIDL